MALGSTQPLTEMSTRNHSGVKKRPAPKADKLAAIWEQNVENVGASTSYNPKGLHSLYGDKIHLTGIGTCDLPACSIVPQPTTLPRSLAHELFWLKFKEPSSVSPDCCRDKTSMRPRPFPSKSFPIRHLVIILQFYPCNLDTGGEVRKMNHTFLQWSCHTRVLINAMSPIAFRHTEL
jgi:hypothetical protein